MVGPRLVRREVQTFKVKKMGGKEEEASRHSEGATQMSIGTLDDGISYSLPSRSMMTGGERTESWSKSVDSGEVWSDVVTSALGNLRSPISRSAEEKSVTKEGIPQVLPYGNPVSSGVSSLLTRTDISSWSSDSCAPVATSKAASRKPAGGVFTCTAVST